MTLGVTGAELGDRSRVVGVLVGKAWYGARVKGWLGWMCNGFLRLANLGEGDRGTEALAVKYAKD